MGSVTLASQKIRKIALKVHKIYHIPLNLSTSSLESPDDTFVNNLDYIDSLTNELCTALFYAIRQFYAIAIFFMGRLVTYGV